MVERKRTAVDALVDLRAQCITLCFSDHDILAEDDISFGTDQIFRKLMAFHTVKNIQLLAYLITACLCQVISSVVEELGIHQVDGTIDRSNFICTLVFVNRQQSFVCCLCLISVQCIEDLLIISEYGCVQQHVIVLEFAFFFRHDDVVIDIEVHGFQELLHRCRVESVFTALQIQ